MKITAVRHGETDGNVRQITQSHAPGILTSNGVEQAKQLALLLENERFDIAYTSDLKRAADTAEIIMEKHANIKLVNTLLLRERSLGTLDGIPYSSVPAEFYSATDIDNRPPEGESLRDVRERLIRLLNEMYTKHPEAHVLIVSHGWTLKIMRSLLTELSLLDSWANNIGNGTVQTWTMSKVLDPAAGQESQDRSIESLPYFRRKIPVSNGLSEFHAFTEQYPDFILCPYIADKDQESWDKSTSRVYMNQVLPGLMYVPVNIPGDDPDGLGNFLTAVTDNNRVAAVNITQPHKSSPVFRKMFFGDKNSTEHVDTLMRNTAGKLEPYDLNATAFVEWYRDEVGDFTDKTVIIVGVGGVGEPMAKAIAKLSPVELILVDLNDKNYLVNQLRVKVTNTRYCSSVGGVPQLDTPGNMIVINAAGKEAAADDSGVAELLSMYAHVNNVFVDIRPQLEIDVVKKAKDLGWQSYTGFGMNARNDYVLLNGIAKYSGLTAPSFEEFQKLVAAAS